MDILYSDINEIVEAIKSNSDTLSGKKILFTGARGFLGRYFIEIFNLLNEIVLSKPLTIIALDNLITSGESGAKIPNYKN